jgi:hypothetical protein
MSAPILPFATPPSPREVIEASLRLFGRSVLPCLPLATIGTLVGQLPTAYDVAVHGKPMPITAQTIADKDAQWWALYLIGTLASLVVWAVVLLKQQRIALGAAHSVPLGATLARLPAILVYLVSSFLVVLLAAMPFGLIVALVPLPQGLRAVIVLVPVLVTSIAVSLGWPALVVDGRGPFAAVDLGLRLAATHWRRLLVVLIAILATVIVMVILASLSVGVLAGLASGAGEAAQNSIAVAIVIASVALLVLYLSAYLLVVFHDLRQRAQASSSSSDA